MTIDFDDAWNRAREGSPFSNGTEGSCWQSNWCDQCQVDAPFRNGIAQRGCRLLEVALLGRTPAEWLEQAPDEQGRISLYDHYHCVEFRRPGGGGGEPKPKPEPPDMDGLFDRPEPRVRMFVPNGQAVAAGVPA